jgi:hypothetical protein
MSVKAIYSEFFIGGTAQAFQFSSKTNSMNVNVANDKLESTCFQDTAKTYVTGDTTASIDIAGYFSDAAAGDLEQEFYEMVENSESLYAAALGQTSTAACPAYVGTASELDEFSVKSQTGNLITVSGKFSANQLFVRGLRVHQGTISATGTTTYIDLGAAGSAGGYAWLWVTSKTGTITSATVVLQSDDNTGFSSAATEGTFTFSALGAYQIALSGAVDRYVRLNVTSKGGATNFYIMCVAAVSGVTY